MKFIRNEPPLLVQMDLIRSFQDHPYQPLRQQWWAWVARSKLPVHRAVYREAWLWYFADLPNTRRSWRFGRTRIGTSREHYRSPPPRAFRSRRLGRFGRAIARPSPQLSISDSVSYQVRLDLWVAIENRAEGVYHDMSRSLAFGGLRLTGRGVRVPVPYSRLLGRSV